VFPFPFPLLSLILFFSVCVLFTPSAAQSHTTVT
jgi:hypothetical protein